MTLPSFFVIGAMKAGTTSLYTYLAQHPEIHMSLMKEPHFFGRPEDAPYPSRIGDRDEYEKLFETTARVRGEASPTYSLYPQYREVPQRIAALVPEARFIYLVRNPIDRIVSQYIHNVAEGGLRLRFADAVGDLSDRGNPYVYPCLYATQIEQYLKVFDAGRLLVIDQADLLGDRVAALQVVFRFLEVDASYYSGEFEGEVGVGRDKRQLPLSYVRVTERLATSPLRRCFPRAVRRSGRRALERAVGSTLEAPLVTEAHHRQIRESCADEVVRLRQYTGGAYASWDF